MRAEIDYHIDEIQENQRRLTAVPQNVQSLDIQYTKGNLNKLSDPSPWVDNEWRTVFPGTFLVKEGFEFVGPWVYVINTPYTDSGGWIYRKEFSSHDDSPKNTVTKFVRYRKWRRRSVPIHQVEAAHEAHSSVLQDDSKNNAYNIPFIARFFKNLEVSNRHFDRALQVVVENRRIKLSDPKDRRYTTEDPRPTRDEDEDEDDGVEAEDAAEDGVVVVRKHEPLQLYPPLLPDPPSWTTFEIPKHMHNKYYFDPLVGGYQPLKVEERAAYAEASRAYSRAVSGALSATKKPPVFSTAELDAAVAATEAKSRSEVEAPLRVADYSDISRTYAKKAKAEPAFPRTNTDSFEEAAREYGGEHSISSTTAATTDTGDSPAKASSSGGAASPVAEKKASKWGVLRAATKMARAGSRTFGSGHSSPAPSKGEVDHSQSPPEPTTPGAQGHPDPDVDANANANGATESAAPVRKYDIITLNEHYTRLLPEHLDPNPGKVHHPDDFDANDSDWAALSGWNFLIDTTCDDAGWQYSDRFYRDDSGLVNRDHWDRKYERKESCRVHSVKRRFWCRILVHYGELREVRRAWRKYISDNRRGLIKEDQFFKQGHLRTNWTLRNFELKDYSLTYRTPEAIRGCVDLANKHVHYNDKVGACLEESGGRCNGFTLTREFKYHNYFPIYYERESRYEDEAAQLRALEEKGIGAKMGSLIFRESKHVDMKKSRSYSFTSSSTAQSALQGVVNRGRKDSRFTGTSTASTFSRSPNVASFVSLNAKGTPIIDSYARRMNRGFLNLDTKHFSQRDEFMDVLRHQIWLINNSNGDTLSNSEVGSPTERDSVSGRSSSVATTQAAELDSYRIYDVEGSPPFDRESFRFALTIDMMIPPEFRITPEYVTQLPPLARVYPRNKRTKELSNSKDARLARREASKLVTNGAAARSQSKSESAASPAPVAAVPFEGISRLPQKKHAWITLADKDVTHRPRPKPLMARRATAAPSFPATALTMPPSPIESGTTDSSPVSTIDHSPVVVHRKSPPPGTRQRLNSSPINVDVSMIPPDHEQCTPSPVTNSGPTDDTSNTPDAAETAAVDISTAARVPLVHRGVSEGLIMKKKQFSDSTFKLRFLWISNQEGVWKLHWSKSQSMAPEKHINIQRISKCVRGRSLTRTSGLNAETGNFDEDRHFVLTYRASPGDPMEPASGGIYLKSKSVTATEQWVESINNIMEHYETERRALASLDCNDFLSF